METDGYDAPSGDAWSVVVKGHAVEIDQLHDVFDALFPWHAAPKHRFVRIEPVNITGRRFRVLATSAGSRVQPVRSHAASE